MSCSKHFYTNTMLLEPLGDAAYILRDLAMPAHAVADALNAMPPRGLREAVASYETVGLYVDPHLFDAAALELPPVQDAGTARRHEIPVCYEMGQDLEGAAEHLGLRPEELVRLHTGREYRCFAVGFCPGFPYLGTLPERIAGVPRRSEPRIRVEAGSVAVTGRQTGVYPLERPGGWAILGRTPLTLVDVEKGYFPIRSGDLVRFAPIHADEFRARRGERL